MATDTTGIKYYFELDDERLKEEAREAINDFNEISKSASEAGRSIDKSFSKMDGLEDAADGFASLSEQIQFQKGIIQDLQREVEKYEKAVEKAAPGLEKLNAQKQLNTTKRELAGEIKGLEELEKQAKTTADSQVMLRSRIKEIAKELANLEASGQRGTTAYRQLQEEGARLTDAYGDAVAQMRILANDQKLTQGIISGLTGVSAAFSAVSGVVGLFTKDQEKLQRAMLKVQSLMSITVGLQQIQQTLNKDSAFRLVIINGLKEWWVKVTEQAAAAQTAETAAMTAETTAAAANTAVQAANATATAAAGTAATGAAGAFRVLGAAIKSIPGIGWAVAAISAIVAGVAALVKRSKEAAKAEKEHAEQIKKNTEEYKKSIKERVSGTNSVTKKYAEEESKLKALLAVTKNESSSYENKRKAIAELNKTIPAYNGMIDKTGKIIRGNISAVNDYIAKIKERARAEATTELLIQAYMKQGDLERQKRQMESDKRWYEKQVRIWQDQRESTSSLASQGLGGEAFAQADKNLRYYQDHLKQTNEALSEINGNLKKANNEVRVAESLVTDVTNLVPKATKSSKDELEKIKNKRLEAVKSLKKLMTDAQSNLDKSIYEQEENSVERRLNLLKHEYEETKRENDKLEKEMLEHNREIAKAEAKEKGTKYDEGSVKLTDEQVELMRKIRLNTDKRYAADQKKIYDEILSTVATMEERINGIIKDYAEKREVILKHGTQEQLSRLNDNERKEIADLILDTFKADEAVGRLAESFANLGKNARGMLYDKLYRILQYTQKKRAGIFTTEDVSSFAKMEGVSEDFLNSVIKSNEAMSQFQEYVENIGNQVEPIDNLKKAVENYRKAVDKAKSGEIVDVDAMEKAKELMEEMIRGLADNILEELTKIGDAMIDIGDAIGNESLSTAGNILNDVVGNIQAAEQGAQAWGGWWGAIIGGATDLLSKIVKYALYGDKAVEKLRETVDKFSSSIEYYKEIAEGGWDTGDYYKNAEEIVNVIKELKKLNRKANGPNYTQEDFDRILELTDKLRRLKNEIQQTTALEAYQNVLKGYDEQVSAQEELIKNLEKHPKRNAEAIKEAYIELSRLVHDQAEYILQYAESVVGVTSDQLFSDISDMISEAFDSGKDSVDDFAAYYNRMVRNMIKTNVMQQVLESVLSPDIQAMADAMMRYRKGELSSEELAQELQGIGQRLQQGADDTLSALYGLQGVMDMFPDLEAVNAASGGLASASQDSIDELNGRMTVIQAHTASLVSSSAICAENTGGILYQVRNISGDTAAIRRDINYMRNDLDAIRRGNTGIS